MGSSASSSGVDGGSAGWTMDGEYLDGKKKRDAVPASEAADEPPCKPRWRGVKGLDGEC